MKQPVFISGLRKSGTSLVKTLLDSHPDLFVFPPNELHLFRYSSHEALVKDKLGRINDPVELLHAIGKSEFISRMGDPDSPFYRSEFDKEAFSQVLNVSRPDNNREVYRVLMEAMYKAIYKNDLPSGVRWVSKTVLETEFFPEILDMFPDARFVYVLRNPYAHFFSVVKSMRTHTGRRRPKRSTYEGMKLSPLWDPYPYLGEELSRMKNSYYFMEKYARLYPDQFYVLVYDSLVRSPEEELGKLCRFLDLRWDKVLLEPTILGQPWGGNSWQQKTFKGIDRLPLDQWKKRLSGGEIRLLNKHFKGLIERYFELVPSKRSLIFPFHISEYKPWVYIGNRMLYHSLF